MFYGVGVRVQYVPCMFGFPNRPPEEPGVTFRTVLRRVLVGLVVKPWRLLWFVLVGAGDVWLVDQTPAAGFAGRILRMLIFVVAAVVSYPVILSALHDGRHDRGKPEGH